MTLKTPPFVGHYVHLLEPHLNDMSGELEYSILAAFPAATDLSGLEAAMQKKIEDFWPDARKRPTELKMPFFQHEKKASRGADGTLIFPDGFEAGGLYLNLKQSAKSGRRPQVVDQNLSPIMDASEIYSGAMYIASVTVYAYDNKFAKGVNFGLSNVMKIGEGNKLAGGTTADQDFADVAAEANGEPQAEPTHTAAPQASAPTTGRSRLDALKAKAQAAAGR